MYKYIRNLWKRPKANLGQLYKDRLQQWRRQGATVRIEGPTRLDRARSLGYKAKQGIIVVRQRVKRGGRKRPQFKKGRRSKHVRRKKIVHQNYQSIAENRCQRQYLNMEVLNSYYIGKDKNSLWYEIILIDPDHPVIKKDQKYRWLKNNPRRALRGKTSAARKSRGLVR